MIQHNQIEKKVLRKINPDTSFRLKTENTVKKIRQNILNEIKKRKLPAKIVLVGSTAKDTFLQGNMDIDFFLLYPTNLSKEKIAKETISIANNILNDTEESYAEHPYLKGFFDDFLVEIVPAYKIEKVSQKLSAVDRTPLHTEYVKENLEESQKNEVRLFKKFLTGIDCYGAEAQIQGFSGYLCEILIIKYKNFRNLLKNAKNWSYGQKISLKKGDYPDFDTPLVFIDPVDPERNVSSALSEKKFDLFLKACHEYLKNPSIKFFYPEKVKPWSLEKITNIINESKKYFVGISFKKPDIIDENLFPQIRKAVRSITESCRRNHFKILDSDYFIDEKSNQVYIILKLDFRKISDTYVHAGPPTDLKQNKEEFIKKWENNKKSVDRPYEKEGRLWVRVKRDYDEITNFLENNLEDLSLGRHLDKTVDKSFHVLSQEDLLKNELRIFWTKYLDDKKPWDR